jgi:hypothetical protein
LLNNIIDKDVNYIIAEVEKNREWHFNLSVLSNEILLKKQLNIAFNLIKIFFFFESLLLILIHFIVFYLTIIFKI